MERKAVPNTPEGSKDQWRDDEFVRARKRLITLVHEIERALNGLDRLTEAMTPLPAEKARDLAEIARVAACGAVCTNASCDVWVAEPGRRSGLCNTCAEYKRVNKTDRPHKLVHRDPVAGCERCEYRLVGA